MDIFFQKTENSLKLENIGPSSALTEEVKEEVAYENPDFELMDGMHYFCLKNTGNM